jgi:hypothetical protein
MTEEEKLQVINCWLIRRGIKKQGLKSYETLFDIFAERFTLQTIR